jgi:hypothetical protein
MPTKSMSKLFDENSAGLRTTRSNLPSSYSSAYFVDSVSLGLELNPVYFAMRWLFAAAVD